MLETNIRIIQPGMNLYVWVRQATVTGPNLTSELIEKSCGVIRSRYHLAAVAHPKMSNTILIASNHQINPVHLDGEDWELDVTDSLKPPEKLTLSEEDVRNYLSNYKFTEEQLEALSNLLLKMSVDAANKKEYLKFSPAYGQVPH